MVSWANPWLANTLKLYGSKYLTAFSIQTSSDVQNNITFLPEKSVFSNKVKKILGVIQNQIGNQR